MIVLFPNHCFSIYSKPDQTLKTLTLSLVNVILRLVGLYSVIMAISECLKLYFAFLCIFLCSIQILYNNSARSSHTFHARAEIKLLKQLYTELPIAP